MSRLFTVAFAAFFVVCVLAIPASAKDLAPRVKLLSAEDIQATFCPKSECLEVVAFYHYPTQTIVLRDTFDPQNNYDLSAYLHEFVHHLQNLAGESEHRCVGEREGEAYGTQIEFLKQRGDEDPHKTMGTDAFTLHALTSCHWH